jgi:uncharacterized protein (TIGR03083 family)
MSTPHRERLATGLREQTAALAAAVEGAEPGRQVPTCPEWPLRNLVEHVGQAHRWATELIERRSTEILPLPEVPGDLDAARWSGWLIEGAEQLVDTVERAHADVTVWTPVGPGKPVFWLRRMLHDTSVHHADGALTVGAGDAYTLAPDLAADAIDEGMELMSAPGAVSFQPALAELCGQGETLLLRPMESNLEGWLITRTPSGITWERRDDGGDAVLRGRAVDLVLVMTRRISLDDSRVEVTGDRGLFEHWLANTPL